MDGKLCVNMTCVRLQCSRSYEESFGNFIIFSFRSQQKQNFALARGQGMSVTKLFADDRPKGDAAFSRLLITIEIYPPARKNMPIL